MTKHTPGSWEIVSDGIGAKVMAERTDRSGRFIVAELFFIGVNEESKANARLIAAAPELLEAVKLLIHPKGVSFMAAVEKAKAAIAKAESSHV